MLARFLVTGLWLAMGGSLLAQTIQLPSFSNVGVNTTVIVPDSGGGVVARDRRASHGYSTFSGLPRTQGWGIRRQAGAIGVTAQIHDPAAADAALRAAARRNGGGNATDALTIGAGTAAGSAPPGSMQELAALRHQQVAETQRDAIQWLQKARDAHQAGKASVAKIYYRMAARQATGELHDSIVAEWEHVAGKPPATESGSAATASTRTSRDEP